MKLQEYRMNYSPLGLDVVLVGLTAGGGVDEDEVPSEKVASWIEHRSKDEQRNIAKRTILIMNK